MSRENTKCRTGSIPGVALGTPGIKSFSVIHHCRSLLLEINSLFTAMLTGSLTPFSQDSRRSEINSSDIFDQYKRMSYHCKSVITVIRLVRIL